MRRRVLIADDEPIIRETLAEVLSEKGFQVVTAGDGLQAVHVLAESDIDVALVDIRMPVLDGFQVLAKARESSPRTRVIMITAFGTVEDAVDAIKRGASDYVTKPIIFDDILIKIDRLFNLRRLADENQVLMAELEDRYHFRGILGTSPALREVLEVVRKLAQTQTTTLISGESGTGKELIARAIHYSGLGRDGRFMAINCAALPETLAESELFGYKRGAFTGAVRDKLGLFELAEGGTIFLDEISSMSLVVQAKLLRAIEEKRILPVGGVEPVTVNARILCATNHVLREEMEAGRFREDLYYRLCVVEIHIPPLRERREDIPVLAEHFIAKHARELGKDCPGVSDSAMQALMAYSWPGNVRELENVIERALIFSEGHLIEPKNLPFVTAEPIPTGVADGRDLKSALKAYEKRHILQVLRSHDFDKNLTARSLNIGLSSLYRKIDELGIDAHADSESLGQPTGGNGNIPRGPNPPRTVREGES